MNSNKTVFIGLSGGVDSAVSAYLLKKEGYKVVGAFIKTWQPEFIGCTWKEERRDAMRVAAHLEIPFVTIDLEKEYKDGVADYMISEYKIGRTPNPDVMCNKEIKFGGFLKKAIEMGADYVATGHYARKARVESEKLKVESKTESNPLITNHLSLATGVDPSKDQSYFLWTLNQDQLSKIIFPIGNLQKSEVRKIAKKIGLPNAEKKDSQGICFLGKISMKEFLSNYIEKKVGKVFNINGEEVGNHDGAVFLTIGERHGFTITKKTPDDEPLYVLSKDIKENSITVGTKKDLESEIGAVKKIFELTNVNWINSLPKNGKAYAGQVRYHQTFQKVFVENVMGKWEVKFDKPQTGASGQSTVIYDKEICLGGGVII